MMDVLNQNPLARLNALAQRHSHSVVGRHVQWRSFGQGAPLVLLHGGHGSWLHWARNIDALSRKHQLWLPDMPGFGESDAAGPAGMADLLDAMQAGLDQLLGAQTHFDLAGFSFGGLVAAKLAARCQRVRRLALLGPGGHGGERRPTGVLLNWHRLKDEAQVAQAMRQNLLLHMLHHSAALDAQALQIHTEACRATRFRSKPISLAGGLGAALAQYQGELLLAWGEHDVTATPEQLVQTLALQNPQRQTLIVPGAGHWVQYEAAEVINQQLLSFFKSE
ncbi:MAG: alpha/beta fold hydrolase [Burkholderiaceae bacterium]